MSLYQLHRQILVPIGQTSDDFCWQSSDLKNHWNSYRQIVRQDRTSQSFHHVHVVVFFVVSHELARTYDFYLGLADLPHLFDIFLRFCHEVSFDWIHERPLAELSCHQRDACQKRVIHVCRLFEELDQLHLKIRVLEFPRRALSLEFNLCVN